MRALLLLLLCAPARTQTFERTLGAALGSLSQAAQNPPSDEQLTPLSGDLPNFAKVHDWLYRGAQPTKAGFESLKKLGVKTIVDLRDGGDRKWEEELAGRLGMRYVPIPMSGVARPKDEQVEEFLALFQDFEHFPIFVHCRRGADRTGALVAAYRIDFDHWKLAPVRREMLGFGMVQPAHIAYVHAYYQKRHPAD